MKKSLFVILICLFCLTACSSSKKVPDTILEWSINDFIRGQLGEYYAEPVSKQDTKVIHSYDPETKTDAVTMRLTLTFPKHVAVFLYEATYQYHKSDDQWDVIRGGQWTLDHVESFQMSSRMEEWVKALEERGQTNVLGFNQWYDHTRLDYIDLEEWGISIEPVTDCWDVQTGFINVLFVELKEEKAAAAAYNRLCNNCAEAEEWEEISWSEGSNYVFSKYYHRAWGADLYVVKTGNKVFEIRVYDREELHGLLYQMGCYGF